MKKSVIFLSALFAFNLSLAQSGSDDASVKVRKRGYIGSSIGIGTSFNQAYLSPSSGNPIFNLSLLNAGYRFGNFWGVTAGAFGLTGLAIGGVTVGPMLSLPLSNKLELDVRPMAGLTFGDYTSLRREGYNYGPKFAMAGSLQLRYHCSARLSLLLHTDLINSKITIPSSEARQSYRHYNSLFLNAGLAYRLR